MALVDVVAQVEQHRRQRDIDVAGHMMKPRFQVISADNSPRDTRRATR